MQQDKFSKGCLAETYLDGRMQVVTVVCRHRSGYPYSRLGEYVVVNDDGDRWYVTEGRLRHSLNPKID